MTYPSHSIKSSVAGELAVAETEGSLLLLPPLFVIASLKAVRKKVTQTKYILLLQSVCQSQRENRAPEGIGLVCVCVSKPGHGFG